MKMYFLIAQILFGTISVSAQTYSPPNGHNALLNVQVTRTNIGEEVHLKVTITAPLASESLPVCNQAFLYGWIGTSKNARLRIYQTKGEESPEGFKAVRRTFTPGETITLEVDLPTSFVDAVGAHLHAGVGLIGGSYWPTQNLLVQK